MRIGIDARFYGPKGKGLGRYVSELLHQLEKSDQENEYLVFLRQDNYDLYEPSAPNFHKVKAEFPWYGWREQLIYPFWLNRFQLDLMHFAHFNVPMLYRRPYVVTIHDLILLSHPTTRATTLGPLLYRLKYWAYRLVIKRAALAAKRIITVTEYSKQQILHYFPSVNPKKIAVTYEACAEPLAADPDRETDSQNKTVPLPGLAADRPFALYVGSAYPHKNLDRLLQAFRDFRAAAHSDWQLVLVGGHDYFYDRLREEAALNGLDEEVIFFGRATDEELNALYEQASLYVFPSLCEGFGLPPLEAMSHDLPVVAARSSCLPEVLGPAAEWFDPDDPADISRALDAVAIDETRRDQLIALGHEQLRRFSWSTCGQETLAIYQQAIKQP
jgi:glycosyltransferase involved in cell wall biosynthesis